MLSVSLISIMIFMNMTRSDVVIVGIPMNSIVPKSISIDIDLSKYNDDVREVDDVVGDNIEYLVYLDLQVKGAVTGLSWRPRFL